jgi:hypothetical protein
MNVCEFFCTIDVVRFLRVKFSVDNPTLNFFKVYSLVDRPNTLMGKWMFTMCEQQWS